MISPFKLERYFAQYEFKVRYLLSSSDCEALTLPELLALSDAEGRELWDQLRLGYTESQGHPRLREAVAGLYPGLTPEEVVVAAPEELIYIAMHTLLRPGDRVISVFPAYQSLYEIARSLGCTVVPWPFRLEAGGWRLDPGELEAGLKDGARMIVINFPHNPTGCLPPLAELEHIVSLAHQAGAYLFSDEMYRLLEYEPARRLPPACTLYERAISLSGLSKTFALAGLRLGWLATQDPDLPERWLAFKDYTTICNSAPSEILGLIALRAKEQIVARSLEIVRANLSACEQFFAAHPDRLEWIAPQAGSVAFPRWTGPGPVEAFCQEVLEKRGVMVVPGSIFDFNGPHFRVGLGRRNLPQALEQVGEYLERGE